MTRPQTKPHLAQKGHAASTQGKLRITAQGKQRLQELRQERFRKARPGDPYFFLAPATQSDAPTVQVTFVCRAGQESSLAALKTFRQLLFTTQQPFNIHLDYTGVGTSHFLQDAQKAHYLIPVNNAIASIAREKLKATPQKGILVYEGFKTENDIYDKTRYQRLYRHILQIEQKKSRTKK